MKWGSDDEGRIRYGAEVQAMTGRPPGLLRKADYSVYVLTQQYDGRRFINLIDDTTTVNVRARGTNGAELKAIEVMRGRRKK